MAEDFLWVGNHPCLDFINTEIIDRGKRGDLLPDVGDLLRWLKQADLLKEAQVASLFARWQADPQEGEDALQRVRAFRAALRQTAEEIVDTGTASEESVAAVNERLKERVSYRQITRGEGGGFYERFTDTHKSGGEADYILGLLAETAADLLCHADLSLIRRCENPQCILFFYDISKNHARRWCSMSGCGNRAKAAAHYRRTRSE